MKYITRRYVSPAILFVVTWVISHIAAYIGPKELVYGLHDVPRATITVEGSLWVIISTAVFLLGVFVANRVQLQIKMPNDIFRHQYIKQTMEKSDISLLLFYLYGVAILFLLFCWTVLAIYQIGSFRTFLSGLLSDWHSTGQLWREQKPFPGARLLYTGFISVMIFSAASLAVIGRDNPLINHRYYNNQRLTTLLIIGLIPLTVLPILVSQRLLLAAAIIGSLITYISISDKGIPVVYPIIGTIIGFSVWTIQEVVRVRSSPDSVITSVTYSIDRILFYFSNDIGNLHRSITYISEHTYGFETFGFIFQYLFIEDDVRDAYLTSVYAAIEPTQGGGTATALGIPYLDFGVFGLVIIFLWGYVSQIAYSKSSQSFLSSQIYGLIAASIVLSWHSPLWSLPIFWHNVSIIILFIYLIPYLVFSLYYYRHKRKGDNLKL
ncbi:O-antigen polymerase [Natronoarchaeum sp. GCM10025703]|uniref:O-antigen polymerase n=1 Tax=unclassified Natronoarchaeum TaxID=2620183 RepID=UPI003621BFA2